MNHQQNNNMTHYPSILFSITQKHRRGKKRDGVRRQKSQLESDWETVKSMHIQYLSFYNKQAPNKRIWILNSHDFEIQSQQTLHPGKISPYNIELHAQQIISWQKEFESLKYSFRWRTKHGQSGCWYQQYWRPSDNTLRVPWSPNSNPLKMDSNCSSPPYGLTNDTGEFVAPWPAEPGGWGGVICRLVTTFRVWLKCKIDYGQFSIKKTNSFIL